MRNGRVSCIPGLSIFGLLLACAPTARAAEAQPVHLRLTVPSGAEVWFNGAATTQTGTVREFVSPAVALDKNYTYKVRVRWMQDGKPVEQERSLRVSGGQQVNVEVTQQNMSVSRAAFYPPTIPAPGQPSTSSPNYPLSSSYEIRSGPAIPSWVPYDWSDFERFKFGRE